MNGEAENGSRLAANAGKRNFLHLKYALFLCCLCENGKIASVLVTVNLTFSIAEPLSLSGYSLGRPERGNSTGGLCVFAVPNIIM